MAPGPDWGCPTLHGEPSPAQKSSYSVSVSGVRAWFVRDFLEVVERERGRAVTQAALAKLTTRLTSIDPAALRQSTPNDVVPLHEAEELFLGLDMAIGDGSGRVIETAGLELFSKALAQGGLIVPGDLMATMLRLRAPLEYPFVDERISFDLASSSTGFVLYLGVARRPRSARVLRHLAAGAIRAAQRFCREGVGDELKIYGETLGDRVHLDVRCRVRMADTVEMEAVDRSTTAKRPTRVPTRPAPQPTLDAVERIFSQRRPSGEWNATDMVRPRSEPPPARSPSGSMPSEPPPRTRPPSFEPPAPHTPTPVVVGPTSRRAPSEPAVRTQSGFTKAPDSDTDDPESKSGRG